MNDYVISLENCYYASGGLPVKLIGPFGTRERAEHWWAENERYCDLSPDATGDRIASLGVIYTQV